MTCWNKGQWNYSYNAILFQAYVEYSASKVGRFTFTTWAHVTWVSEISGCDCEQKRFWPCWESNPPSQIVHKTVPKLPVL